MRLFIYLSWLQVITRKMEEGIWKQKYSVKWPCLIPIGVELWEGEGRREDNGSFFPDCGWAQARLKLSKLLFPFLSVFTSFSAFTVYLRVNAGDFSSWRTSRMGRTVRRGPCGVHGADVSPGPTPPSSRVDPSDNSAAGLSVFIVSPCVSVSTGEGGFHTASLFNITPVYPFVSNFSVTSE